MVKYQEKFVNMKQDTFSTVYRNCKQGEIAEMKLYFENVMEKVFPYEILLKIQPEEMRKKTVKTLQDIFGCNDFNSVVALL